MFDWISFSSSQSRWGLFALLLALTFFCFEGSGMLSRLTEGHSKTRRVLFVLGILFTLATIAVAIYWLITGSQDPSSIQLEQIQKTLDEIKQLLQQKGNGN